jgi:hypothetical protein
MAAIALDNPIARYWHGEGRLAPLYWLWGVVGSFALAIVVAGLPLAGVAGLPWALAGITLGAVYTLWILVSIWRCAENIDSTVLLGAPREAWTWLARALTIGWALNAAGMSVMLLSYLAQRDGSPF